MLRLMYKATLGWRMLLIIGAVIVAPVSEELIFRGLLQSLLARLLAIRPIVPFATPVPMPPPLPGDGFTVAPLEYLPIPVPVPIESPTTAMRTWAAIVITSVLFALMHPGWTMPAIFTLSLCLGYVYERTGSLWASMTLHASF